MAVTTASVPARELDVTRAAELLVAAAAGSAEDMRALLALCEPFVRARARRDVWRRDQVDDVVQDTLLQLFLHAARIRQPETLAGWLATVVRRAASCTGHRAQRMLPTEDIDVGLGADSAEDDAIRRWDREEVTAGVNAALDRLSETDRELIVRLHRSDRPSYRDIGAEIGRPVGSLGPTRQRVLRRLRNDRAIAKLERTRTVSDAELSEPVLRAA